jgi:methionyl-tRNA synthetase
MDLARLGNKYLADEEPWKVIKTDVERVKTVLNISLQITANLTICLQPFLPFSMNKLRGFLNLGKLDWEKLGNTNLLSAGHQLNTPELLFEKIEDDVIEAQVQKLLNTKKANELAQAKAAPAKPHIEYDDFGKMDIRVGTILEAEKVAKTKKLLKLLIDTGIDKRTVVSGIAEYYEPEALIGKQVSILVNLAPKNLKGIESQGMILCAENAVGSLSIVSPDQKVKNGAEVK